MSVELSMEGRKMITKNKLFIIGFALFFVLLSIPGYGAEKGSSEYIWVLDINVTTNDNGEVMITKIGRFGPFRRYSWFRVGDVIEAVDGSKPSIFDLQMIDRKRLPKIRFRRGTERGERQISLERSYYGYPSWANRKDMG